MALGSRTMTLFLVSLHFSYFPALFAARRRASWTTRLWCRVALKEKGKEVLRE